jgi:DnaJ-class molecular chaperone
VTLRRDRATGEWTPNPTCQHCDGTGRVMFKTRPGIYERGVCPGCHGTGKAAS